MRLRRRSVDAFRRGLTLLCLSTWFFLSTCLAGNLQIQVVRGDATNNNPGAARRDPAPLVRVTDTAGNPVKGAIVIFTAPESGPSVEFGASGTVSQAETDETGSAGPPSFRATGGNGPVTIHVLAEKDGDTANAVLHQMNLSGSAGGPDLDMVVLPRTIVDPKDANRRGLRIRLIDDDAKPVGGAPVEFEVRIHRSGKPDELQSEHKETASDGTAEFSVELKTGKTDFVDVLVRSAANGLTATRFFAIQ